MIATDTGRGGRPPAVVHVDLDGARHIYRAHGWNYAGTDDPLFESGLRGALEMLALARVTATLFVIAEDMSDPRKRKLVRAAVDAGHEVASHSLTHGRLTAMSPEEKRREITESRRRLASAVDTDVRGFRAPGFHIDAECLALIADTGYAYDSSMLSRSVAPDQASTRAPHRPIPGKALFELPVPCIGRVGLPFHPSYSLVVGDWYFKTGVRAIRRAVTPSVLLYHLTDFADPLPRSHARAWKQRLFTLSYMSGARKRARSAAMLDYFRAHFDVITTAQLLAVLSKAPRPEPVSAA